MDLTLFSNELPGDDINALFRRLHFRSKERRHTCLAQFLRLATFAFRDEVKKLSHVDKTQIPHIESIVELRNHAHLRKGKFAGAIEGVMLVILELGCFIGCVVLITPFKSSD